MSKQQGQLVPYMFLRVHDSLHVIRGQLNHFLIAIFDQGSKDRFCIPHEQEDCREEHAHDKKDSHSVDAGKLGRS